MYATTSTELPCFTKDAVTLENSSLFPVTLRTYVRILRDYSHPNLLDLMIAQGFFIKGYTDIFVLLIMYIVILSLS